MAWGGWGNQGVKHDLRFRDSGGTLFCHSRNSQYSSVSEVNVQFKGMNCPQKDMWDVICLLHLLTWLNVSDYHYFWNNERSKSFNA